MCAAKDLPQGYTFVKGVGRRLTEEFSIVSSETGNSHSNLGIPSIFICLLDTLKKVSDYTPRILFDIADDALFSV
jgi:hypothetical protein